MLEKHFSPQTIEPEITRQWELTQAFKYDALNAEGKPPYTIIMPPPNVTGSLHMGHALTFTLQDVLVRHQRKLGRQVLWQPGIDHAGIATQMVVERQLDAQGLSRHDLGRDAFIERVWEWKAESGSMIDSQLKRLGASAAWERSCFTMDENVCTAVRKVFAKLYKDGLIYRDKRLVHWDLQLQSAISDLEVVHKPSKDPFYFVNYPLADTPDAFITVATTRPETMFADVAVAVNPTDERYMHLVGKRVKLPLTDRTLPIIADDYCDPEKGTGAVKITPGHDVNDFEMGKRHQLDMISILDAHGKLVSEFVPEIFRGLDRLTARPLVATALEEAGFLLETQTISHTLPYGDRSETPVESRLMDQWYVRADVLAAKAIEAVESGKTKFVPQFFEATYFEWMRNIQPWCISRQIWWGHRINAWYGPDEQVFVAESLEEAQAQADAAYGKPTVLTQDTDVLDTWFSSALWPFVTLGWPEKTPELAHHYPSSVLVTGHDIIFFWVARMMMMGLYVMEDVPFKDVYIHALVKDEKGQKMSKSKGNVIDPVPLMDTYGADAMRLALTLQAAPGRDIKFSTSRVEGAKFFVTKLWNASRFSLMNECRLDPAFDPSSITHPVNSWIVSQVLTLEATVFKAMEDYRFNEAAGAIYQSVWGTFCDWYVEFSKPLIQDNLDDPALKTETQKTTAWALERYLHLLHPLAPFVTEELYAKLYEASSLAKPALLCISPYPTSRTYNLPDAQAVTWSIGFIEQLRAALSTLGISQGTRLQVTYHTASKAAALKQFTPIIMRLARLESLELVEHMEIPTTRGSLVVPYDQGALFIPLGDILDVDKEVLRLTKEMEKTVKELSGIAQKLSNPQFLEKAPDDIVDELKERQEQMNRLLTQLTSARDRFQG